MALALHIGHTALVILELAVMLLSAFILSGATQKLRLPNVTAYIVAGIVIGPCGLKWIDEAMVESMGFVTDVALSFIAFGVGRYFKWETLKNSGARVLVITALESLGAAAAIAAVMLFVFHLSLSFSLLLGAVGAATAPASTLMTIRQYKAKGHFVETILQVVALDDAVALLAFSACATVSQIADSAEAVDISRVLLPIVYNLAAVALGAGIAFLLKWCEKHVTSRYDRLLLVVILLLTLSGLCAAVDISPLLSCMALGMVHANISHKGEALFKAVERFHAAGADVLLRRFRHAAQRAGAEDGGRHRGDVFLRAHPRQVRGGDGGSDADRRGRKCAPLPGAGAGAAGGRVHRSGGAGRAHAARGNGQFAQHHRAVLRRAV